MNTDKHFEELRSGIYRELLNANLHNQIFWELSSPPQEVRDIRNKYISFFKCTMTAHLKIFIISLHNVIHCDSETCNIPRLINYIDSNSALSGVYQKNQLRTFRKAIWSHCELTEKIEVARDKFIAHNELHPKSIVSLAIKREEIQKLLDDLNTILDRLSYGYDGMGYSYQIIPAPNVAYMLKDLNEQKKARLDYLKQLAKEAKAQSE